MLALSQSQMVELFALPKPERREFVEEHREALESGEMSVKRMKAEIVKLKMENSRKDEALGQAEGYIQKLERDANELNAMLDEERRKPAPEPVVQEVTVTVNQPSEEQMAAVRAEVSEQLRAEFDREREAIHEDYGA